MFNGLFMCKSTRSLKSGYPLTTVAVEGLDQDYVCEGGNRGSPLGEDDGKNPGGCCCGARGVGGGES